MEIINQLPSFATIIEFITDGFFLGALIGAVLGPSVWTMMERGTHGIVPMLITAALGLFAGMYIEGDVKSMIKLIKKKNRERFQEEINLIIEKYSSLLKQ